MHPRSRRKPGAKYARDASEPLACSARAGARLRRIHPRDGVVSGLFHRRAGNIVQSHTCAGGRALLAPHQRAGAALQKQIMRPSLIVTQSPCEPSTKTRPVNSWPPFTRRMVLLAVAISILMAFAAILSTTASASQPQLTIRRTTQQDVDDGDLIDSERRRLTVFGADDRRAVSDPSLYPYSAIGLLKWNAGHLCTASLIGSKYAVTAAECVLTPDGKRRPSTVAKPEFVVGAATSGTAASTAHVVKIHRQSHFWKKWRNETYVILELDLPLGDTVGKFLLPTAKDLNQTVGKTLVQMVGFDADAAVASTATLKFSKCTCYFPASFNGPQYMLHHDCDTSTVGSPGSALLVRYTSMETYIIGIHTNAVGGGVASTEVDQTLSGYSDDVANRGVLGPFIQQHLASIVADDKQESAASASEEATGSSSGAVNATTTTPPTTAPPSKTLAPLRGSEKGADSSDALEPSDSSTSSDSHIPSKMAYTCIGLVAGAWVVVLFIAVRHMSKKNPQPDELEAQVNGD